MIIRAIKTRVFSPPQDDLFSLIKESIKSLKENSIVAFTSKIISIWQGRCVKIDSSKEKADLVKKEAELYLERETFPILTIKNNILIPMAGIDESNGNGYYILWPHHPFSTAKKIYQFLKRNYRLKKFGVIICDSHTFPLRIGTMGISLAHYGFEPLKDYRGEKDIFGRKLKMTQLNIADSLAVSANLVMGEGKERTPIAIIEEVNFVEFREINFEKDPLKINPQEDIYYPVIWERDWKKGKGKK